jgi:hypothetical protein
MSQDSGIANDTTSAPLLDPDAELNACEFPVTAPAPSSNPDFERRDFAAIVEAVGDHLRSQVKSTPFLWRIIDRLIEAIGPPGPSGRHDDELKSISVAVKEAHGDKARGWGPSYLALLRRIGANWPPAKRFAGLPVMVHHIAGDRKTLEDAEAAAKKDDKRLTVKFVRDFKADLALDKYRDEHSRDPKEVTAKAAFFRKFDDLITRGDKIAKLSFTKEERRDFEDRRAKFDATLDRIIEAFRLEAAA